MKRLVIFLSVLMLVASAQAKVLTAKQTVIKYNGFNKDMHGWYSYCFGVDVTVRYNPTTDRGYIEFGESCLSDAEKLRTFIRVYDADGFQINTFDSDRFEPYASFHIMATDLTEQERKAIRKISIAFYEDENVDWGGGLPELKCPSNRVLNKEDVVCERKCDDNHVYDKYTDKCIDLYDSKETAELDVDKEELSSPIYTNEYPDQSGEWCQKADGEWYFDNKVKDGKCPKVQVRKDPERESAYGNELYEKTHCPSSWQDENGSCKPGWDTDAPSPWYSQVNAQWYCDYPYRHDGQGHCVL